MTQQKYSHTRILVEGALMVALATVLSILPFIDLPHGGSITLFSMLPMIVMSCRHGVKWGLFTSFVFSLAELALGLKNLAYCQTLTAQLGCVLLDYLLAFTVLGLACVFARPFKNRLAGVATGTAIVCALRFVCSFLSGYLVWYDYEYAFSWMSAFGWGAWFNAHLGEHALCWVYSFAYNLSYMLPETLLTVVGAVLLCKTAPLVFDPSARKA